jgi:hypothetical protein
VTLCQLAHGPGAGTDVPVLTSAEEAAAHENESSHDAAGELLIPGQVVVGSTEDLHGDVPGEVEGEVGGVLGGHCLGFFHALSMAPLSAHVKGSEPLVTLVHTARASGTPVPPLTSGPALQGVLQLVGGGDEVVTAEHLSHQAVPLLVGAVVGRVDLEEGLEGVVGEEGEFVLHALSMAPLSAHVKALGPLVTLVHSGPGA